MLRKIRIILAVLCFLAVTLLFLDFTGTVHAYLGWMAKIQFLPALLALNAGVIAALVILTLIFGRVYCSVICPLGILQDGFAWLGRRGKKNRNKYAWSPAKNWLRYTMLGVMILALIAGIGSLVALLAPYSAYGRIVQSLFAPLYGWGNNALAYLAERKESYAFYRTDVWLKGLSTLIVAAATLILLAILAWRNGRTYCNTICPVGTVLSFFSRFAMFRPVIDKEKCKNCKLCEHRCKAACINIAEHKIDYSRCVDCFDCIDNCKFGALRYRYAWGKKIPEQVRNDEQVVRNDAADAGAENLNTGAEKTNAAAENANAGRRAFLAGTAIAVGTAALHAQEKKVDGGLAVIEDKKKPVRQTPIVPPGARGIKHFYSRCTACQLCVSVCPNGVLRPSTSLKTLMQPESSYERGFCRPECTKCSDVCPAGAIEKITVEEKTAIQIGRAVWNEENCLSAQGVHCRSCVKHCPTGAIQMVGKEINGQMCKIPVVNEAKCIGCGACENLCPARPFSAIHVEGLTIHNDI